MKTAYSPGDECWIALGPPPLWRGIVITSFTAPQLVSEQYIIEIDHPDYPHLEIRDALLMSDTAEGPLPFTEGAAAVDDTGLGMINPDNTRALMDNLEGTRLENVNVDGTH